MASKRTAHEEGNDERDRQVSGKRRFGHSEQPRTLYRTSVGSNSTNDMAFSLAEPNLGKMLQDMIPPILEKEIRPILKEVIPPILEEVIPPMLQRYSSPRCGLQLNRQQIGPSGGRALQLCFMNRLPSKIFTETKIRAEDGSKLQIALCDTKFQHRRVKEDASSIKVQICVLKGDFGSNGSEDWTAEDFNANTLGQRESKPPLLNGDKVVTLKNGVGYVENIVFTDNSSWTKSSTFRLGLKVWQSTSNEVDVKEGRSEPLRVKDKRGEACKKHDLPSLNDKVWRLQKIRKDGKIHRQLSLLGIKTVKNLLQRYTTTDEASLQQSAGNIPRKSWDKIIEHANACEIDDHERYIYHGFAAEQSVSLVFNCIYKVLEVSFNGQNYCSLESLNLEKKHLVEIVKQQAYSNLKDLKPYEPTPHSLLTLATMRRGAPDEGLQQFYHPIAPQGPFVNNLTGQQHPWPNLFQPSTSTSSLIDETALGDQVCSSQLPDLLKEIMSQNWAVEEQLISEAFTDHHNGWPISGGSQIDPFAFSFTPPTSSWEQQVGSLYSPFDYGAESSKPVHTTSKGRAKIVWGKIRTLLNVLKWVAGIAVQRKAKAFDYQD